MNTISTFKFCTVNIFYSGSSGFFLLFTHRIFYQYGRCFRIFLRNFLWVEIEENPNISPKGREPRN